MVISCPHCSKTLRIKDNLAGKRGICPACKHPITIPKDVSEPAKDEETAKTLPAAVREVPRAPTPPPRPAGPPEQAPGTAHTVSMPPPPIAASAKTVARPTGAPPPLPKLERKTKVTDTSASVVLSQVVDSLVSALSARKMGFFLLAGIAIALLCVLLLWLAATSGSGHVMGLCSCVAAVVWVGGAGLMAGGVAYLTHMEKHGRYVKISDTIGFCGRRFLSLLGGTILLLIVVYAALFAVNGCVLLSNLMIGPLAGALLFLPQFALNFMVVVAAAVGVLIPCAIAVEDIGAFRALSRLIACVRRDTKQLMIQLAMTAFFGALGMIVLLLLVGAAMLPAAFTNVSLVQGLISPLGLGQSLASGNPMDVISAGQVGLPLFFSAAIFWLVMAYPAVYWVVSFTSYYETVRPRIAGIVEARQRASP